MSNEDLILLGAVFTTVVVLVGCAEALVLGLERILDIVYDDADEEPGE